MLAQRVLTGDGYRVVTARDGFEAIELYRKLRDQISLIILDFTMPVMDGWEATRRIKAADATRHIPVIALTANAMAGDRESALAAGCDDFDTKPIDFPRLLEKIRLHLRDGGQ